MLLNIRFFITQFLKLKSFLIFNFITKYIVLHSFYVSERSFTVSLILEVHKSIFLAELSQNAADITSVSHQRNSQQTCMPDKTELKPSAHY